MLRDRKKAGGDARETASLLSEQDGSGDEQEDEAPSRSIKLEFNIPRISLPKIGRPAYLTNERISFFFNALFVFIIAGLYIGKSPPEACVFQPTLEKDTAGNHVMRIRPEQGQPDGDRTLCMVISSYQNSQALAAVMTTWGAHCDGVAFFVTSTETVAESNFMNAAVIDLGPYIPEEFQTSHKTQVAAAFVYVYYALKQPDKVNQAVDYIRSFKWFSKCDIDTFLIPENMRRMVTGLNSNSMSAFLGDTLYLAPTSEGEKQYVRGTGHYILGSTVAEKLGESLSKYFKEREPCHVKIQGRKGYNAAVNGVYNRKGQSDGHYYYGHTKSDLLLYFLPETGQWTIGAELGSKDNVYAIGNSLETEFANQITGTWKIWAEGSFEDDPEVFISCANPDEEPPESPRSNPYIYYAGPSTFEEAKKKCEADGYQISSVHNEIEAREIFHICEKNGEQQCWVGNYAKPAKADPAFFLWGDESEVDYFEWASGHPSEAGDFAMCGRINPTSGREWLETACEHKYAFICDRQNEVDETQEHGPDYWCNPFSYGEHEELMVTTCLHTMDVTVQEEGPTSDKDGREFIFHQKADQVPQLHRPTDGLDDVWWHSKRKDREGSNMLSPYPVSFSHYLEPDELKAMYYTVYGIHLYGRIDDGSGRSEVVLKDAQSYSTFEAS